MKRVLGRSLALAAATLALTAMPARASWSFSGCGGVSFNSCATVTITISGDNLDLYVSHNAGSLAGTRFGVIGLANFGGTGVTGAYFAGDPGWDFSANLSSIKVAGFTPLGAREDDPNPKGLFVGNNVTFRFTKTGGDWNLDNAYFIAHAQGGPTNPVDCGSSFYSVKRTGTTTGTFVDPKTNPAQAIGDPNYSNADCFPDNPPTAVVPEPATMVLLATGLVGLAGVQLRRRKNTKV